MVTSTRPSKPMRTGLNSDTIAASSCAWSIKPMYTKTCRSHTPDSYRYAPVSKWILMMGLVQMTEPGLQRSY